MKTNHILALLALLAGIFAAFTNHTARNDFYPTWKFEKDRVEGTKVRYISPHHLAELLYQKQELLLLDARNPGSYENYHIPTALPLDGESGVQTGGKSGLVVIYGSAGGNEVFRMAREFPRKAHVLQGGMEGWHSMVLFPDLVKHRIRNRDQIMHIIKRSMFFGGEAQNTQLLNLNMRESRYREGC